jgi:hypothetical protein
LSESTINKLQKPDVYINDSLYMFCFHTLSWYCKGSVIAYDVFRCLLLRKVVSQTLSSGSVLEATFSVFGLQAMVAVLLLAPSVVLSVADRVQTNAFCSQMLLLLSLYLLLIRGMRTGLVSAEHACFSLQFCSCYLFFCYFHAASKNHSLLLGHRAVRLASMACMFLFPVLYSHLLQDCMHVSPYALVFVFSGEVSGCVCACVTHMLVAFECLINALYVRVAEV